MGDNGFAYIFLWRIATLAANKYSLKKKPWLMIIQLTSSQCTKYSLKNTPWLMII